MKTVFREKRETVTACVFSHLFIIGAANADIFNNILQTNASDCNFSNARMFRSRCASSAYVFSCVLLFLLVTELAALLFMSVSFKHAHTHIHYPPLSQWNSTCRVLLKLTQYSLNVVDDVSVVWNWWNRETILILLLTFQ